jgi:hypothetical protein
MKYKKPLQVYLQRLLFCASITLAPDIGYSCSGKSYPPAACLSEAVTGGEVWQLVCKGESIALNDMPLQTSFKVNHKLRLR